MPDEYTPEIHEPEYQDEKRFETPTVTGDETNEQVILSWFEDSEAVAPELIAPEELAPETPTDVQALPMPAFSDIQTTDAPPEEWIQWAAPTDPADNSWTDAGYSIDWGEVEATWPEDGELWTQPQPQVPLSDVIGPGHEADQYWGYQGQTNYCVLYSAASIIGEIQGEPVDMDEMVALADGKGWLGRDADGNILGVVDEHFDDLLAAYGVASHNINGEQGAWESLNTALTNDQRVIVSLDSTEIDAGTNQGTDLDADHAVAVTGIDYARGVVIVNDSAREAGLEIPMQVFYDAWRDGNFHMTVTDTAVAGAPGFSVLPFTLHLPAPTPTLPGPELA